MTPQQIEQHRRECEAKHVLALPFGDRAPYIDIIEKRRGKEGRQYLVEEIHRQHKLAKVAA